LNPGPPALEASTIPLGYRGGGSLCSNWADWRLSLYENRTVPVYVCSYDDNSARA